MAPESGKPDFLKQLVEAEEPETALRFFLDSFPKEMW